jgi:urease accessory protein
VSTAAVAAPDGELAMTLIRDARGRTRVSRRRQRFPLRTTMPFHLDPAARDMAFVYVQNPTGGVFGGERLEMSITAGDGARVHVTTQSATKLYRADGGRPAHQALRFALGAGAYVEHIPDPLIPHAGAAYVQSTAVELGEDAIFVAAETIAPGRRARGERFLYDRLELSVRASRGQRELCADSLRLEPGRARVDRRGVLGRTDYLVSLIAVAPGRDLERLAASLDVALSIDPSVTGAAGELPNSAGALVRILAPSAVSAERALRSAWTAARLALIGVPPPERRK